MNVSTCGMNEEQLYLRHVVWTMMLQVQSGHAV